MHYMFDRLVTIRVCDVTPHGPLMIDIASRMNEVSHLFLKQGLH